jgi:hypothetical protein
MNEMWKLRSGRAKYEALSEERRAFLKKLYDPEFRRLIEQIRQGQKRQSRDS